MGELIGVAVEHELAELAFQAIAVALALPKVVGPPLRAQGERDESDERQGAGYDRGVHHGAMFTTSRTSKSLGGITTWRSLALSMMTRSYL